MSQSLQTSLKQSLNSSNTESEHITVEQQMKLRLYLTKTCVHYAFNMIYKLYKPPTSQTLFDFFWWVGDGIPSLP